jgi:hypothetical protein
MHPVFAQALAPWAPPQSEVHQVTEQQRIADDLAYNEMKNSGELLRSEIKRAAALDRQWGVA